MGGSFSTFAASMPAQTNKVIAITGCTSGTGLILAKMACEKGATVLMLNRESSRSAAALEAVSALAKEGENKVVQIACDLMDFDSVRAAAEEVKTQFPEGLDVLCNNAGIMAFPSNATKQGYDVQMQVNHLSHFLLTKELMPLLELKAEANGEARIINHSSIMRKGAPLDRKYLEKNGGDPILGDDTLDFTTYSGGCLDRYHMTKLANMVFTYALHEKLTAKGSKVKALVAHPGIANTDLSSNMAASGAPTMFLMPVLMYFITQSPEDGTRGIARCCLQEGVSSGSFYGPPHTSEAKGDAVLLEPEDYCRDAESTKMLWEASEEATGKFEL